MDFSLLLQQFSSRPEVLAWSAQRRLHGALRAAILQGVLPAGMRLLSSRALALELGSARNTVVYAYEQLQSEGLLCSGRRGSVVSDSAASMVQAKADQRAQLSSTVSSDLSRRSNKLLLAPSFSERTGAFVPGVPALFQFPMARWGRLLDQTWRAATAVDLAYGEAGGDLDLRRAIAEYLCASRGLVCDADQVIITDGTQASLNVCAQAFCDAGDQVWMENPGYQGAQIAFTAAQLKLRGIALDEEGLAPSASDWREHPPKLIYVTPSHQYPVGCVLSLERRLALLMQARAHGSLVIEDDYDSEFRYDGPPLPAMQGLISDAPVIYLGTFSKTMFPALRIAYMVVPRACLPPVLALLGKNYPSGRVIEQRCLANFIQNGYFSLHVRRMRRLYQQRRDCLLHLLRQHLGESIVIHGDSAGMHLSIRFRNPNVDDLACSHWLEQAGIVAPALSAHTVGRRRHGWSGLMLGYAQVDVTQMSQLVVQMARILRANNDLLL